MHYSGREQLAEAVGQARLSPRVTITRLREHSDTHVDVELTLGELPRVALVITCVRRQFEVTIDCRQMDAGKRRVVGRWIAEDTAEPTNPVLNPAPNPSFNTPICA
jgi:hypothetical protein